MTEHTPEHIVQPPRPAPTTHRPATWRVLRWPVPVDDQPHQIGGGQILHTACREPGSVDVWTLELVDDAPPHPVVGEHRTVQVFGTGQPLPDNHRGHIGTGVDGFFVWHVFILKREA